MSISEIFASKGELYFRKVEHLYLKELLNIQSDVIIALGGGTPCYANNMELISQSDNSTSIHVWSCQKIVEEYYIVKCRTKKNVYSLGRHFAIRKIMYQK